MYVNSIWYENMVKKHTINIPSDDYNILCDDLYFYQYNNNFNRIESFPLYFLYFILDISYISYLRNTA